MSYVDAALTTAWGGRQRRHHSGDRHEYRQFAGAERYGVAPAQTTPAPGTYTDTITAAISF